MLQKAGHIFILTARSKIHYRLLEPACRCMVSPWSELKHENYGIPLSLRQDFSDPKNLLVYIIYGLQIFQPTDSANEEEALRTTQILVKTIYGTDELNVDDAGVQGLVREACEECIGILKEPEKSQARPAAKILCAFMSTTREHLSLL